MNSKRLSNLFMDALNGYYYFNYYIYLYYIILIVHCSAALDISSESLKLASDNNFDILGHSFVSATHAESVRAPRVVRIGVVQFSLPEGIPTGAPVMKMRDALHDKAKKFVIAASLNKVNVLCFQEAWSKQYISYIVPCSICIFIMFIAMPFGFCTREKLPWCEYAESAEDGVTTRMLQKVCFGCFFL